MQCYGIAATLQQTACVSCLAFGKQRASLSLTRADIRPCLCAFSFVELHRNNRARLQLDRSPWINNRSVLRSLKVSRFTPRAGTGEEYTLEGQTVLKIKTGAAKDGAPAFLEFQVLNSDASSLLLHWGALQGNDGKWRLPSHRPQGTREFSQGALQSPFVKNGDVHSLKLEIPDTNFNAIEFLLKDDANNKWFKLNGKNFRVQIPSSNAAQSNNASIPVSSPRSSHGRISRKKRDFSELINKNSIRKEASVPADPRKATPLELAAQKIENENPDAVIFKKIFKLGDKDLLVLATRIDGEACVRVASNFGEPLALHWSLSQKNAREWELPPEDIVPAGSKREKTAADTPFGEGFEGEASLQSVEINLGKENFLGMPFVLRAGSNWIKNIESDFYVPLQASEKKQAKVQSDATGTCKWLLDDIASLESEAERSLMHRYNIGADLVARAKDEGELAIAAMLVWLRFMATRQLTWNKNYNVKPREISAAQDRLTDLLRDIYLGQPHNRELVRLTLATVGRGGQGDVGQRIRDEILVIQRNNDCKGGMMEEWHQKLHNNTSPDDVVICQALLDYIQNGYKMEVYWKSLISNGVTKDRLASYDRPIVSEPDLRPDQKDGLVRDLTAYMRTLKAVHSGADLESAVASCMGYSAQGHDFMGTIKIHPVSGLSGALPELLSYVLGHVEDRDVLPLLEGLLEARRELLPSLQKPQDRLKDIIFLDLALDSTVRTAVERGLEGLNKAPSSDLIRIIILVLENLCLSSNNNEELVYCLKHWYIILDLCNSGAEQWALQAKSVLDRTRLVLGDKVEHYQNVLQQSAAYLGGLLGVEQWAIDIFTEEMIRAGSAASLSQLLNRLDPVLRKIANLGSWQVISPVEVQGYVTVVHELGQVQDKVYENPVVLIAGRVKGEEEIPDGAVAVLTPDMPDVLSHVSVRARNGKVCFATCFDPNVLTDLRSMDGQPIKIQLTPSSDLTYTKISEADLSNETAAAAAASDDAAPPLIVLKSKTFKGKYAVSADEFTTDLVGAKSLNTANLRGKLPAWVKLPTSVALPFGVCEEILSEDINKDVSREVDDLKAIVSEGDFSKLKDIREAILKLKPPTKLVEGLKNAMLESKMRWPGNEGEQRWEQAWMSIRRVWASKWNERAYFSTRKAKIDHENLRMAVLVQEIICADYAFVIHTVNPSNGNTSEIYAEVVKGLGETLVGAYQGRALSFITQKSNLKSPKIIGYPSKRIGLFINPSVIFRSDSNGEDLEGYAGAGLYDSVPMDREEERAVDYSTDKLLCDKNFQMMILSNIATAGAEIEKVYGTPQDIEGCIKDDGIFGIR